MIPRKKRYLIGDSVDIRSRRSKKALAMVGSVHVGTLDITGNGNGWVDTGRYQVGQKYRKKLSVRISKRVIAEHNLKKGDRVKVIVDGVFGNYILNPWSETVVGEDGLKSSMEWILRR